MYTLKTLIFITTLLILTQLSVALSRPEAIESLLKRLDSKRASSSVQESAAIAVLKRLLPSHIHSFVFEIVSKVHNLTPHPCQLNYGVCILKLGWVALVLMLAVVLV